MVKILEERCIGCGKCVKDCFPQCLELRNGKAHTNGSCIECGHCFAVCPTNAIHVTDYPENDIIEYKNSKPSIDSELLLNFIKSRRSIRHYKAEHITPDTMRHILEAGRFTPTGGNVQDVRYLVIQENLSDIKQMIWKGFDKILQQFSQTKGRENRYQKILQSLWDSYCNDPKDDRLFFNAPALLIVLSNSGLNGGLASSNIELMANAEGLGVLYSGFIQMALTSNPAVCEYLKIDPAQIRCCMLIGYPNVTFQRSVPRKPVSIQWM